jgi:hypothetical protein
MCRRYESTLAIIHGLTTEWDRKADIEGVCAAVSSIARVDVSKAWFEVLVFVEL